MDELFSYGYFLVFIKINHQPTDKYQDVQFKLFLLPEE